MKVNELASLLGDACYVFLAVNALWGAFCLIIVWRRLIQLRFRRQQQQSEFLTEVERHVERRDFDGAAQLCEDDQRAVPQLVHLALLNRDLGYSKVRQLIADQFQSDVLADLEYRVSWVSTVIKSGPLLGLFGTVLGMMAAFGRIGTGEKVEPSQIADEISIALICTAMGLGTAIPFNFMVASVNIRIRKLQETVNLGLSRFMDALKSVIS